VAGAGESESEASTHHAWVSRAGACARRQSSHTHAFFLPQPALTVHGIWAGWAAPSQPAPCMAWAVTVPASPHRAWHSEEEDVAAGIKGRNFLPTLQWRSVGRGGRIGAVKFIFELFFKFFPAAILFFAVNC